ncbi:MAG: hypothetical protein ABII12_08650 [Planctomycetota bacterium]
MVFVLGILTMLALIGLVLIAKTHGESKRVANELSASSGQAAMNGVIQTVRETLRRDIWGKPPSPLTPELDAPLASDSSSDYLENNEPYDAPGKSDRWLTSTLPYYWGDILVNATDPAAEISVLAWHRVSYLGTDIIRNDEDRPFMWAAALRAPPSILTLEELAAAAVYNDDDLTNVWVLQTPPTALAGIPLIPGSTTNLTIAEARARWESDPPVAPLDATPRFPYFDTNANGIIDLYDADGDGVPDSPISFIVPFDNADPHGPQELYAVIRIVDHASMLNVNVASGMELSGGGLTFNELTGSDLQRRGRRMTELLFDDTVHADDTNGAPSQVAGLVNHRDPFATGPVAYDAAVVRTKLVGSPVVVPDYSLYGEGDEASLRHRGSLVPRDRLNARTPPVGNEFATIDRALPGSLLWSRMLIGDSYDVLTEPRWNRFNANFLSPNYEGNTDAGGAGWRALLRDDEPYTIRRPLLTTVSHEVVPPPSGLTFTDNGTPGVGADDTIVGLSNTYPINILTATGIRMAWPVLDREFFPDVPDWKRVLPIDINMSDPDPAAETLTKVRYIQYMAAAMYMALKDVRSYQGTPLYDSASTFEDDRLNREYLAWQFAVNMADYRDSDGIPTVVEWVYQDPGGPAERRRLIFGVEKQPFFTEAYAHIAHNGGGPSGTHDPNPSDYDTFFAFELFVPPGWIVQTNNLYIRAPGSDISRLIGLSEFERVSDGQVPVLDGGTATGNYFVFCGPTTHSYDAGIADTSQFYRFAGFDVATDGHGSIELVYSPDGDWNNPQSHVIDIISADHTGGPLAGGDDPGEGAWADENEVSPGQSEAFSLHRSTKGWRFTTAWQVYSNPGPSGTHDPASPPPKSLGQKNAAYTPMDSNIPESIWPTLLTLATPDHEPWYPKPDGVGGFTLVRGFTSGRGFEAFDSVAEISRILMVGPVRHYDGYRMPRLSWMEDDGANVPATLAIARIAPDYDIGGDLPGDHTTETELRIMAGRPDFVHAVEPVGGKHPWTWRLFDYLTTQSPLYDGIDNDGDDPGDGSLTDLNDPTEGITTLNRLAGRINVNTAPAVVLRSLPYMSMLPTSAEYVHHVLGGTLPADPALLFNSNMASGSPTFWDSASSIVCRRESREVPLRLYSSGASAMVAVATADRSDMQSGPGGTSGGSSTANRSPNPFVSIAELADPDNGVTDLQSGGVNDHVFSLERFWTFGYGIPLLRHSLAPAPGNDKLSPDFRYRDDGTGSGTGLYDYVALADPAVPYDNGGIRSRDIFLTRWSNMLTTRSDVFTAYIALLDENGNYVHRSQVTLDRSECFRENPADPQRRPILPKILHREDSSYMDDTR